MVNISSSDCFHATEAVVPPRCVLGLCGALLVVTITEVVLEASLK